MFKCCLQPRRTLLPTCLCPEQGAGLADAGFVLQPLGCRSSWSYLDHSKTPASAARAGLIHVECQGVWFGRFLRYLLLEDGVGVCAAGVCRGVRWERGGWVPVARPTLLWLWQSHRYQQLEKKQSCGLSSPTLWLGDGSAAAPVLLQTEVSSLQSADVSFCAPLATAATQGLSAEAAGPAPCLALCCRQLLNHVPILDANVSSESLGSLGTWGRARQPPALHQALPLSLGRVPRAQGGDPPGHCPCRGELGAPKLAVLTGDELQDLAQSPSLFHVAPCPLPASIPRAWTLSG